MIDFIQDNISAFDLIVFLIIAYSMAQCAAKGFMLSLLSFSKWLLALIITIILVPKLNPWIQDYVESKGYSIVRELVGHGIGAQLHLDPQIPNFSEPSSSHHDTVLEEGMCLAIEPMVNLGSRHIKTDSDGWTIRTQDGKPSAHFEHSILITKFQPRILT